MIVGGSFGAGKHGMGGRAFGLRFLWTWPNARISVMGGEQAAGVLTQVKRDALEKNGSAGGVEEEAAFKAPILEQYARQSNAYCATARLWDDGIIVPRNTRHILTLGLTATAHAPVEPTRFGVFRLWATPGRRGAVSRYNLALNHNGDSRLSKESA